MNLFWNAFFFHAKLAYYSEIHTECVNDAYIRS